MRLTKTDYESRSLDQCDIFVITTTRIPGGGTGIRTGFF